MPITRQMMTSKTLAAVLASAALVVLAGCGGSSAKSSASGKRDASTTAKAPTTTVSSGYNLRGWMVNHADDVKAYETSAGLVGDGTPHLDPSFIDVPATLRALCVKVEATAGTLQQDASDLDHDSLGAPTFERALTLVVKGAEDCYAGKSDLATSEFIEGAKLINRAKSEAGITS
jgi:ABC-type glycerol-3-phosphate transport system substrate-binding protein